MSRLSGGYPSAPRWSASPTPRAPRFRRSELAAVGRRELLRWVNRTVGVDYVQVESCADGVALAQLIDAAYPDARVPLYRLDFATRHEHDRARNLEVVRATLDRLDLDVPLDVKEVSRGVYRACDEALRWLYLVVQRERPPSATRGYDGRARRLEALQKRGYLARAPSKSPGWRSAASWDERGSGGDPSCASPSAAATPSAYAYDPATPYATPSSSDAGSDARKRGSIEIRARVDRKSSSFAAASRAPTREENDERTPEEATVSVGNRTPASPIRPPAARQTRVFFAGAVPAAVRPATAPPARRRSTVSVVASARVDISPERGPREPVGEASSGDEKENRSRSTPFVPRHAAHAAPSLAARLYTPRRSLDKWAEKARLKRSRACETERKTTLSETRRATRQSRARAGDFSALAAPFDAATRRSSPNARVTDVAETHPLGDTARENARDFFTTPRARRSSGPYGSVASSSEKSSVESDDGDASDAFSRSRTFSWTASPPGSAERAARLRRAHAEALVRVRAPPSEGALEAGGDSPAARLRAARAEVAEIKAREASRRLRRDAERQARLEAEALAEARAAEERRLEAEAEEAALYAREVASARREVRLEEARARRERRRREVREALRLDAPIPAAPIPRAPSPAADGDADAAETSTAAETKTSAALAKKRADLASLAEYLKWELAAELKRFEAAKRETASAVRERDDAILRLGIAETRRRLAATAGQEPSAASV